MIDLNDMLEMGLSFNSVDFTPDPVRDQPESRHDRYMNHIDKIAPSFDDIGDGWGGSTLPREIAMRAFPYEDWEEQFC